MDEVQAVVIGAGVIGLAVARELAARRIECLVLERAAQLGSGASSRNSGVLHAGLYYPPGSHKARLCVSGAAALYAHCAARGIAFRRCGKLVVARATQLPALESLAQRAAANAATVEWLSAAQARALEPQLHCDAALLSPASGVLDAHSYLMSLLAEAEHGGAALAYRSEVTRVQIADDGALTLGINGAAPQLRTRWLINCAGAHAAALAQRIEGFPRAHVPQAYFAKGNYFTLRGAAPFTRLIYPLPEPGGLGIHLTLDLEGGARFGPDVEWVASADAALDVNARRGVEFYRAIRTYWPALADGALQPGYAGIRAKLSGPGLAEADFRIDGPREHGVAGIVHLFGIESPGLTASLALAGETVSRLIG
jgi:L-2-hydroxyglutarate oxidase LhgO